MRKIMKKMVIALLVLVSCLTIGCVLLDVSMEKYAKQRQVELIVTTYEDKNVDNVVVLPVERYMGFSYWYCIMYRSEDGSRYVKEQNIVDLADMINSER